MIVHHVKLLELEAIEKKHDKYFLHLKLSFDQDIQMIWEIDEFTAENLNRIINFDEGYRYRLSLNGSWDIFQKQHRAILTQTYLDQSKRIHFSCSEDFIDRLTTVRQSQSIQDLDSLQLISMDSYREEDNEESLIQSKEVETKKQNYKFAWSSVAIIGIIFAISFGLLSHIYAKPTVLGDGVLAESIKFTNEIKINQKEDLYPMTLSITDIIMDSIPDEPVIPSMKLDQAISYSIPKGSVALTFDDGPSKYSREIMDILKEYKVGGTFFFTGRNVIRYPGHIEYINSNGYSIGSHSMNHLSMRTLSYENQENEIIESGKLLEEITQKKTTLFRPPYGAFNNITKDLVDKHQYKIVLWDNDPRDWESRDADRIFNDIQTLDISGSIILLHESQAVIDALPRIIEYLQSLDLEIISLE